MTPAADRRLDAARRALEHLREAARLSLDFELWDGSTVPADAEPGSLRIAVSDPAVFSRLIRAPRIPTLIELYAAGLVDIKNGSFFDLAEKRPETRTRDIAKKINKGLLLKAALPFALSSARPGTAPEAHGVDGGTAATLSRGSDKADIAHHYDVSNDFYRLFLDPEMVYTCAYFTDWQNDLATAQRDKLEMICRKLRLQPGERLLDIGCGWGSLITYAAEHYGVEAVGVTLSEEQAELAEHRIKERGLSDRVSVELRDYRALSGEFDKIASIGMFEHVGIDNADGYFSSVRKLLKPRGLYLHHAITRRAKATDRLFRQKRKEYNAMVRYIFPGAEVDHIGMSLKGLEAGGFEVHDVEGWREHYGRTTELWAKGLMENREAAVAIAGEARTRIWIAYLSGVSLAFQRGTLQIFQTLASRRAKGSAGLPPTRSDLYR
ncbi:cyclopropane-fatty-acyl-phospholipid synthase [Rhodobium orientis]|uniref:SAM-dependent methyltransferase n=1 Tax=Rhodobium orientis TaxID=34017 RepID=A0A327JJF0_9HYPH|nr:cyclopropane-fatty-acyl-phospholipid synthase family protein [Rhodobium orientis]MBB4304991.1 cyclopropane-fatty-acyl-phospholipid synthase [Rhodobium orientis]MBK5948801.1 SAM-dependent methyltransferase [Rhodobium orientis]RAI26439.1 SAM-dependent methyltransferase [Rhodobium orientis]